MNPVAGGASVHHIPAMSAMAKELLEALPEASIPVFMKRGVSCVSHVEKNINTSLKGAQACQKAALKAVVSERLDTMGAPKAAELRQELLEQIIEFDQLEEVGGLCLGHSYMFASMILTIVEKHPHLSAEEMLRTYEESRFMAMSAPFVFNAFYQLEDMVSFEDEKVSFQEFEPRLDLCQKLPVLKHFIQAYVDPSVNISYPYIEEKTPLLHSNQETIERIKKLSEEVDISSVEDPVAKLKEIEAKGELTLEEAKLHELLKLAISQIPCAEELAKLTQKHCAKGGYVESIIHWATTYDECSCVLTFNSQPDEGAEEGSEVEDLGHATCFYASARLQTFIYFDSNDGITTFPDVASMATYIARTLKLDYSATEISVSILSK